MIRLRYLTTIIVTSNKLINKKMQTLSTITRDDISSPTSILSHGRYVSVENEVLSKNHETQFKCGVFLNDYMSSLVYILH